MEDKNAKGRPSIYTQELADQICEMLALGYSIRTVCKEDSMPSVQTFFRWIREKEDFREQYARAKQEAADAMAEDLLDIADDGSNDWMEINKGGYITTAVDYEALNRSKLRVDTRKWLMAKMKPKKYGEKLDLTSGNEKIVTAPLIVSTIKSRNENISDDIKQEEE